MQQLLDAKKQYQEPSQYAWLRIFLISLVVVIAVFLLAGAVIYIGWLFQLELIPRPTTAYGIDLYQFLMPFGLAIVALFTVLRYFSVMSKQARLDRYLLDRYQRLYRVEALIDGLSQQQAQEKMKEELIRAEIAVLERGTLETSPAEEKESEKMAWWAKEVLSALFKRFRRAFPNS